MATITGPWCCPPRLPSPRDRPAGPLTVLYVQRYPDGGSITGLLDVVRGLDRSVVRPVVAFRTPNAFVEEFRALDVEVATLYQHEELAPRAPIAGLGRRDDRTTRSTSLRREARRVLRRDLPATWRLLAVARRHRVDLVHANNDVLSNRDAVVVAFLLRRPVVVHVRWLHEYAADASLRIDRFLSRRVDQFLFMSRAIADRYRDQLPVPDGRWRVLDDPFRLEDYRAERSAVVAADLGLPPGAPVVLHVGRIIPWKGQDVLLRAVASVADAHPDAVVLLVGTATDAAGEAFDARLHELAAELGIADRVRFAGARRDIAAVLALADVVVHSSTTPEPFGRVVVEAMAAGRPVVGADDGGVPEIIDEGVTGLLVAPNDPVGLGAAVAGLLADPERAAALGARAQAAVGARFSLAAHARALEGLYGRLLAPRRRGGGRRRARRVVTEAAGPRS